MNNCFIILAAGESKRFNSKTPKPYHLYNGKPLIQHSIDKARLCKKIKKIMPKRLPNSSKIDEKLMPNRFRKTDCKKHQKMHPDVSNGWRRVTTINCDRIYHSRESIRMAAAKMLITNANCVKKLNK